MARRSALLIAALGIAALGTLLILLWVRGIDERATEDQELVQVLRANETIEAGETFEDAQAAGKIESAEVNKIALVQGALNSTESLKGTVALQTIYPGEQILSSKWGAPGSESTLNIPDTNMAISVELADPDRVAGFVTPGSEVAIFATAVDPKRIEGSDTVPLPTYTRIIVPRATVLGIGNTAVASRTTTTNEGDQISEEVPRTVLTISVNQNEAEKVIFGRYASELTFALLSDESESKDSRGAFLQDLYPEIFRVLR